MRRKRAMSGPARQRPPCFRLLLYVSVGIMLLCRGMAKCGQLPLDHVVNVNKSPGSLAVDPVGAITPDVMHECSPIEAKTADVTSPAGAHVRNRRASQATSELRGLHFSTATCLTILHLFIIVIRLHPL